MTTALAPIMHVDELETIQRTGRMLAASGYFDAKGDTPQAIAMMATKILAGREIGIGPFASVNGIHIISGKPAIGANLMASAVKGSGRYDYRVREISDKVCRIEFFQRSGDRWEPIGMSEFTADDARKAQTKNMDKFARNMLFARAMSNGIRWYCPDVFSGNAVYVPEELGATVDGEGNVIDVTPQVVQPQAQPDVNYYKDQANPFEDDPGAPTDEEHALLSTWTEPTMALEWAVSIGACANVFEAKNSLKKILDTDFGGKLTTKNAPRAYAAFIRRQYEKLAEPQPEPVTA